LIEAQIRAILAVDNGVKALVAARIYCGVLPQNPVYPALTIQPITHDPDNDLAGPSDLQWDRLQIDAWASTYAAAHALYKATMDALNGKSFTGIGYRIGSAVVEPGGGYGYEPSVEVHRRYFDIGVWFVLQNP
jgi:hypothetical protein